MRRCILDGGQGDWNAPVLAALVLASRRWILKGREVAAYSMGGRIEPMPRAAPESE